MLRNVKTSAGYQLMTDYAQTNIQLFRQLQNDEYSDDEMNNVARGYDVALQLFSARFRGSGRPFVRGRWRFF